MRVTKVQISNYRNLDGVEINLCDDCNFIVGENNVGKSNVLSLLNTLFCYRSFNEDDFSDTSKPIFVKIQLKLDDIEIGHFHDLFTVDDYHLININCSQNTIDSDIEFLHSETKSYIPQSLIRCANYVYYNSLRNPTTEINFDRERGVGRFLNKLILQYLKENNVTDKDFLELTKVKALTNNINSKIQKIKSFKDYGISATSDSNVETLLAKVIILTDAKGEQLNKCGYGIQFLILVTLSILERIQAILMMRKDRGIFEDDTNTKSISLIIGLDEPEIHLHPYMQRSLIKYINAFISNKNTDFNVLVKELFDIDKFIGQIIIVTHSPNVLLNDYRQIVRLYPANGKITAASGKTLTLDRQIEKHLLLNFPFIKEAFFSRCVIFVEGDSEISSIPLFARKMASAIDFDDLGISIIQAGGNAVPILMELANLFGINSVGITDRDDGNRVITLPNHYQTSFRDFEQELVEFLISSNKESKLRGILVSYDPMGIQRTMDQDAIEIRCKKYSISPPQIPLKLADMNIAESDKLKAFYLTWLDVNKSFPLGKQIGDTLEDTDIPVIYKDVIRKAVEISSNA
ncbi:MAG: AAA family ATPase [Dehalococcoidales bacterium]|nr:AAA family ATPase [Dehalococcoidales bacterium]